MYTHERAGDGAHPRCKPPSHETTRHAHLILPPASFLSQHHYDLIFNAFAVRQVARWNLPIEPAAPEERADWEIFNGLGAAYAAAANKPWKPLPAPELMIEAGLTRAGRVDPAHVRDAEHGLDLGPLEPSLLRRLETPSGKIECASPLLLAELESLAAQATAEADATLSLIGRRDVRSNNSWMHNAERLVKGKLRHHLHMHPEDLATRKLTEGSRVRVRSIIGSIETEVLGDAGLMRGVVCLPHGFGHDRGGVGWTRAATVAGASYNDLTDTASLDAPSGNAALNGTPVWVEAL